MLLPPTADVCWVDQGDKEYVRYRVYYVPPVKCCAHTEMKTKRSNGCEFSRTESQSFLGNTAGCVCLFQLNWPREVKLPCEDGMTDFNGGVLNLQSTRELPH